MNSIEKGNYVGYLWMSDSQSPNIISGEFSIDELNPEVNPFIVEAQLFELDNEISISIKYADGHYFVRKTSIADLNDLEYDEIKFCGNKMSGRVIKMRRYWRPERDALCEGMDVLKPAEMLFVGFEK